MTRFGYKMFSAEASKGRRTPDVNLGPLLSQKLCS